MSILRQPLPHAVTEKLEELGIDAADVLLSVHTDINRVGHYERKWLAVTAEKLVVLTEIEPVAVRFELPFSEASGFQIQPAVGSGILQARVDGMNVDVLRFTSQLTAVFQKVAIKLDHYLEGNPIEISPEEDTEEVRCPSCGLLIQFPGEPCPRCVDRGAAFVRMFRLLSRYHWAAGGMMALLVLGIALDLVGPKLTQYLVDNVLSPTAGGAVKGSPEWRDAMSMLILLVGILAAVQFGRMLVNIANGMLGSAVGTSITFDMRGRLVRHLQSLSLSYYDRQQVGSLVGRVAYDTEALHGFIIQLTSGFLFQIMMVIGVGIMMFSIDAKLALYTLIPAPLVMVGSLFFWRRIYPLYYRFWDAASKQAGMLAGTLSGVRVVKAFGQEGREVERFNSASGYLRQSRRGVDYSVSLFNPVMALVFQFGGWIVWYVGGAQVLQGRMTLGSLMAFFGYLGMFYGPLGSLTQLTNWLTQFVTQAHRIFELLDTPEEIRDCENPVEFEGLHGEIEFRNVTFGYSRSAPVLKDLNLHIQPGELIGVVGRSGSGKTTLINLLCRFYDVNEGHVLVDGIDVRDVAKNNLRSHVGVVLQEPFLFRGSLIENLSYGKPDASMKEIIEAAKAAAAHHFILNRPHGYDTWVGEHGAGLSGGERQRVGIARVLLTDPKVLILDEATSSVDAESEAAIQAALAELVRGRTTIAIAHRLSTLRNADRILVVDKGVIVESGAHDELMAKPGGQYAKMVRLQGLSESHSVDHLAHKIETDTPVAPVATGALPSVNSHHPRWLRPEHTTIHLGRYEALHVTIKNEDTYGGVYALRCMPVHYPRHYISLRYTNSDNRDTEVGLIEHLDEWPEDVQQLVDLALRKLYFVHTVTAIYEIRALAGYLQFKVDTDLGLKDFIIRWQGSSAQDYGVRGKMLLDTEDNRYLVPDIDALPQSEKRLFQSHIYW